MMNLPNDTKDKETSERVRRWWHAIEPANSAMDNSGLIKLAFSLIAGMTPSDRNMTIFLCHGLFCPGCGEEYRPNGEEDRIPCNCEKTHQEIYKK